MAGYKRFGIDQGNIDLERRLRTIEQNIKTKADANADTDVSSQSRLVPLQVENISITGGTQCWRLEWDSVTAPDLKQYIVQVSESAAFNEYTDYDVDTPYFEYTVQPGVTDVVNYVRVRAVTNLGYEGPWSGKYDIESGLLTTEDFEQGSTTGFVQWSQTSFDDHLMATKLTDLGSNIYSGGNAVAKAWYGVTGDQPSTVTTDTYGPVYYTAVDGGIVFPYVAFDCKYMSIYRHITHDSTTERRATLQFSLLRRPTGGADTEVTASNQDFLSSLPISPSWGWYGLHKRYWNVDTIQTRFFFPLNPDVPGQGDWEYRFKFTASAYTPSAIYIEPLTLKVVLFEFRR